MSFAYKLLAGLVLAAALFASGWYSRTPETKIETVVQTVTKVETQQVDHVVIKTVKQIVTQPDGTVTKTTTTQKTADTTTNTTQQTKKKESAVSATSVQVRRDYSLGVNWQPNFRDPTWTPSSVDLGYRVFADGWITGGYSIKHKAVEIGLRWEF